MSMTTMTKTTGMKAVAEAALFKMPAAPMILAVDDGYDETKVAAYVDGKLVTYSIPSWAQADAVLTEMGGGALGDWYEVDGESWMVGEAAFRPVGTRIENYHTSALNRAIVLHAICEGVRQGILPDTVLSEPIEVVLGLPVSSFYLKSGAKNDALIQRKVEGFARTGATRTRDGATLHPASTFHVYAQAMSAWVDHVLGDDGRKRGRGDNETIAIVDVGGNTSDFALLRSGRVDHRKSGSEDIGVLHILDELNTRLQAAHGFSGKLSGPALRDILQTGHGRIRGREVDAAEIVAAVKTQAARTIGQYITQYVGAARGAAEIDALVVVGGGAESVLDLDGLRAAYPQLMVPANARFANARGMLRYRLFVDRWTELQRGSTAATGASA